MIGNGGASGLPGKSGQGKWAPLKIPHRKHRERGRMQDALTRPKLSFLLLPEFACVFHSLLARRFGQILPSGTGPFCQDIRQTHSKRQQKIFTIEGDRLRHVQKRVKKKSSPGKTRCGQLDDLRASSATDLERENRDERWK